MLHFYRSKKFLHSWNVVALRTAIFEFGWEIVTEGRRRWILFYSQHGGAAFGIFRVEYVSYHHRGVTRHLLPIHNASSRCGSHFEYILAQGELSPKRFDFPFKGSYIYIYIYTCWGRGWRGEHRGASQGLVVSKNISWLPPPRRPPPLRSPPSSRWNVYVYIYTYIHLPYFRGKSYPPFLLLAYVCISGLEIVFISLKLFRTWW